MLFSYGGQYSNNNYGKRVNLRVRRGATTLSLDQWFGLTTSNHRIGHFPMSAGGKLSIASSHSLIQLPTRILHRPVSDSKRRHADNEHTNVSSPPTKLWRHEARCHVNWISSSRIAIARSYLARLCSGTCRWAAMVAQHVRLAITRAVSINVSLTRCIPAHQAALLVHS